MNAMRPLTDEEINVACAWWADLLRQKPSFTRADDDDGGLTSMLTSVMADEASANQEKANEDAIAVFQKCLADILKNGSFTNYRMLQVDYHPCKELADALGAADIRCTMFTFPWKTWMRFEDGVEVFGDTVPTKKLL